jgi:hypothetical protein
MSEKAKVAPRENLIFICPRVTELLYMLAEIEVFEDNIIQISPE